MNYMEIIDNNTKLLHQTDDSTFKPSVLIHLKRKGTLISQKLYNHFLKIVLDEYQIDGSHNGIFYTTMRDMKEWLGKTKGKTNKEILNAIKTLQSNQMEIIKGYDKENLSGADWSSYQLLGSVKYYNKKQGVIQFSMDNIFLQDLVKLNEEASKNNRKNILYAKLEDKYIKNFTHIHTLGMYEFLKDWESYPTTLVKSFDFFIELLGLENKKSYSKAKYFKFHVLEKILPEIQENTNFDFKYSYIEGTGIEKGKWYIAFDFATNKLSFPDFKTTIVHFYTGQSFNYEGNYTVNDKGFLEYTKDGKSLIPANAMEIWKKLYKSYYSNPEKFIQKTKLSEEDFYSVTRGNLYV